MSMFVELGVKGGDDLGEFPPCRPVAASLVGPRGEGGAAGLAGALLSCQCLGVAGGGCVWGTVGALDVAFDVG